MPDQRELFDLAAADATNVRVAAQSELAKDLAGEILANPKQFNPKRLGSLGSKGFSVLLAAVREHDTGEPANQHRTATEHADVRMQATSWRHLRKPEPNHWLRGVAVGAGCGLLIIALGLAVAMFS